MIQFLLNNEPVMVQEKRADVTVLQWLREVRNKTGTKEGCGSGDCGACTVVVASLVTNKIDKKVDKKAQTKLRYESVNSCITFVGALHGKQLITVEDLSTHSNSTGANSNDTSSTGKRLHAVQQAMVDEHGSQCGFCTPGFIMSMFALYHADDSNDVSHEGRTDAQHLDHRIDQYLGGNLCRCTGYVPIKRAARKAMQQRQADQFDANEQATIKALQEIKRQLPMHPRFLIPHSATELGTMRIQYPQAQLLAGGTDLALEVTQKLSDIDTIIYVKQVPELLSVKKEGETLNIGAAVSLSRCMKVLHHFIPSTEAMMLRFGSEQVRNQGTIGGNIANASPIGDLPPLLLALNASLELQRGDKVRSVNINDFYKGYKQTALDKKEFLRSIHIPIPKDDTIVFVHKISKRLDDDISAVCGVFCLQMSAGTIVNAAIAFGGMAATPARATNAENSLKGKEFNEPNLHAAMRALDEDFTPISDARASASYRKQVAVNLLKRCYLSIHEADNIAHVSDYVSG